MKSEKTPLRGFLRTPVRSFVVGSIFSLCRSLDRVTNYGASFAAPTWRAIMRVNNILDWVD